MFSYAETFELIARSPCRKIRIPQTDPRESKIFDSEEIQAPLIL